MRLKVFVAPTFPAAMARLRADLGPDALILGTRNLHDGIEITAALNSVDPPPPGHNPTPDPALRAIAGFHGIPEPLVGLCGPGPPAAALARALRFGPLPLGPSGAGKTLVAVKLATRLVLAGTPPLLINADDQRAGAVEQLAAFTRVLGVRLLEARTPLTLARDLAQRAGQAALIDGPGTNPFDPAALAGLSTLAGAAGARMALVLPAGLDPAEAADIARAYARIGADLLVPTRLDLSRRLGGILAAAYAGGMTLTEASAGPAAADDPVKLTPESLAQRLFDDGAARHAA